MLYRTIILLITLGCSACVQTQPLVSHAHLGHALTTWHDTPEQKGLLQTAKDESKYALLIAKKIRQSNNVATIRRGVDEIGYVINPDVFDIKNYPRRYGVLRALTGVLDHAEYAASSEDSSLNLTRSVSNISDDGEAVINQFRIVLQKVQSVDQYGDNLSVLTEEIYQDLYNAINGGHSTGTIRHYGLADFETDFDLMVKNEKDPRYEPLPKKYVLGLVKLPSGLWAFRLDNSDNSASGYSKDAGW